MFYYFLYHYIFPKESVLEMLGVELRTSLRLGKCLTLSHIPDPTKILLILPFIGN
jgi:hypothetical protein